MKKVIIIDWSAMIQNRLYSLLSSELPMTRVTEIDELKYRIARKLYPVINLINPDVIIIAKDNKVDGERNYWRLGYTKQWYSKNIKQGYSPSLDISMVNVDNKWYSITQDGADVTLGGKFTQKSLPKDIEENPTQLTAEQLASIHPAYKGNRGKKDWEFAMTKAEFNQAMDETAEMVCGLAPSGKIIDANLAEADDVAGVLCGMFGDKAEHTLITIDEDWYQLNSEHTKVYNLAKEKFNEEIFTADDLLKKIVMGDAGDNVKSTWIDGQAVNLGKKKAVDCVDAGNTDKINADALERNRKLITLDIKTIPKMVQKAIIEQVKIKRNFDKTVWTDFTLTDVNIAGLPTLFEKSESKLTQKHEPSSLAKSYEIDYDAPEEPLPF